MDENEAFDSCRYVDDLTSGE